nr:hypothetical protein CFP56_78658 [Quercus suber]
MSRISGGSKQQFSIGGFINVLDHLHKLDEQAFTPLLISVGPIHRFTAKLQTMKKCKERLRDNFIRRANINLQNRHNKEEGRRNSLLPCRDYCVQHK